MTSVTAVCCSIHRVFTDTENSTLQVKCCHNIGPYLILCMMRSPHSCIIPRHGEVTSVFYSTATLCLEARQEKRQGAGDQESRSLCVGVSWTTDSSCVQTWCCGCCWLAKEWSVLRSCDPLSSHYSFSLSIIVTVWLSGDSVTQCDMRDDSCLNISVTHDHFLTEPSV